MRYICLKDVETSTEISSAKEHARYFASLVNMSPVPSSASGLMPASATASIAGSVQGRELLSPRISSVMLLATEPQGITTPSTSPHGVGGTLAHEKAGSLLRTSRASSRGVSICLTSHLTCPCGFYFALDNTRMDKITSFKRNLVTFLT